MGKLFPALLWLMLAVPASAGTIGGFVVPSDLTGLPGGGYVSTPPTYKTDGTQNTSRDPVANPPAGYGYELTNIPIPSTTNRIVTGGANFCVEYIFGGTDPSCQEAKFRTHADFSHMLPDDPVRNFGQPGKSHLHCFFGAGSTNAYSTYASLRHHSLDSKAVGTDVNGTGYWYPCMVKVNPFGNGKNYAVQADWVIVYYVGDPAIKRAHIPVGLRYVFGYNMDDNDAWLQSYIDAANAASSNHSRYRMYNTTGTEPGARGVSYQCMGATSIPSQGAGTQASLLKEADGTDPFNGTCNGGLVMGYISGTTLTVTSVTTGTVPTNGWGIVLSPNGLAVTGGTNVSGQLTGTAGGVGTYTVTNSQTVGSAGTPVPLDISQEFFINVSGPDCWDTVNYWSPGGYKHVIPKIFDSVYGANVCPYNYVEIPHLTLEIHFTQHGWSDRQTWDLASDIAKRTATGGTQATIPPGNTFHTDWLFGWDNVQMLKWENFCLGVDGNQAHQCAVSTFDSTGYFKGAFIGGECGVTRCPQIDITPLGTATEDKMLLIPPAWSGALNGMHIHH